MNDSIFWKVVYLAGGVIVAALNLVLAGLLLHSITEMRLL